MPRALSAAARRAIFAPQTGEAFVALLEISHETLQEPIRVTSAGADIAAGGVTYTHLPFEISLPDDAEEAPTRVTLRIDNCDRRLVEAVRRMTSPATVTLSVALASSPDVIEAGPFGFTLRDARYDAQVVEGELAFEDVLNEPFPAEAMTPARFPGIQ